MPNLSSDVVNDLLDRLSGEDEFRTLFQQNPHAALLHIVSPAAATLAGCFYGKPLASKSAISTARNELLTQLTGTLDLQVFKLTTP